MSAGLALGNLKKSGSIHTSPQGLAPGWSVANRKLSGFDGRVSPVKSASRQENNH
jgi:hypothetical protein